MTHACDTCGREFPTQQALAGHQNVDHDKPWTDREVLVKLYAEQGLTIYEIGDKLGCSGRAVADWLENHGIDRREAAERPGDHADEETLRELYLEEEMSMESIADQFGCSSSTIGYWLAEFDIPTRDRHEKMVERLYRIPPTFFTDHNGYERWQGGTSEGHYTVQAHRLLAVVEYGLSEIEGKDIHHKNQIPWDNRPENIEPVTRSEHINKHIDSEYEWRPNYE
ncbi:helix-turn-helix domain-containing protein [Halostella sp. PRR32]|uniref:HNH endonuclease n=1 Tax=Halostella sp. PRR32 TaxID=3098147 RepID=UPI002B1DC595|nr:helix-turn-helix domain-containing protein [Halostella sp. PRR32]